MRKVILTFLGFIVFVLSTTAQERTVTGKVLDEKQAPIESVSVFTDAKGTMTDKDGNFSITIPASVKRLTFSNINFEQQTLLIRNNNVQVVLVSKANILESVIVTGYGRIKKSEYSGAVDRVSRTATKNTPLASLDQGLQGRVAGLTVLSSSGQPGSAAQVTLRGLTSITGGSTPLYVIDGIPVEAGVFQSLNPNDIESYDVLKDASATSLYGSRGASGVIVITTRRGTGGKMKLSLSSQAGFTQPPVSQYKMMNGSQLLKAQEDYGLAINAQGNLGALLFGWNTSPKNPAYITATPAQQARLNVIRDSVSSINSNWDNIFFRQGSFVRQDVTLTGGTGKTKVYSNFSYYKEEGITTRTDLKRYSWRNNADYSDNKLSIQFSSTIGYTKRNFQESTTSNSLRNPFLASRLTPSTVRLWKAGFENSNDYLNGIATGIGNQFAGANLVQANEFNKNYNDQIKVLASNNINYKITEDLAASVLLGIDYRQTQGTFYSDPRIFYNTSSTDVRTKSGSITESLDRYAQYQVRGGLTYNKTIKDKHEIEVNGYAELIHQYNKFYNAQGFGVDYRRPNTIGAITPGTVQNLLIANVSGSRSEKAIVSQIATIRYSFAKKYIINASYRHDGSSQLPDENRFKNFFSVGAVWDAGKESFIKNIKFINSLRLRGSYGSSANADNFPFGDFGYLRSFNLGTDGGGNQTEFINNVGNPNADWEYTYQTNIGLDFEVISSRLYGSVDIYNKKTNSAYANRLVSQTTGIGSTSSNAATIINRGVEMKLNYDLIRKKDVRVTIYGNTSYNKNEVTDLGGISEFQLGTSLISVGKPLGSHWEVGWAGVEPATGKPLYYDKYGNITNYYSVSNRTQNYGTYFAPWQGGFGLNAMVKGFDLGVFFSYQSGSKRVNNLEFFVENPASFLASGLNQSATLNFWKGPGDISATTQSPLYAVNFSSKYIQDASFTRLKNVTLGYTLQNDVISKSKIISAMRVYVTGFNIFTWTKWRGYDPEDDNNISLSEFPNPRSITAGLEITF